MFAVAAVVAALSLSGGTAHGPAAPATAHDAGLATATTAGVQLVSYTGEQPHLFTIDTVPQGFFVQSQNEDHLLLAPERAKTFDPTKPHLSDPAVYTDKIGVYLQNKDYTVDPTGDEQFTIGGRAAALRVVHTDEGTPSEGTIVEATQIYVVQSPRVYLTVQFDASTGLTKEQMIKVAGGINLTAEAVGKAEKRYAAQTENPKTRGN
ncbi:hypothetical protein ACN261_11385 [Micromonospora sp. WMMD723]|uniref:hypothetical protein n=1 Tax=Micromonospora sp. WMMD723 TaxID=3403465 RepID=UPI003CEF1AF5